MNEIQVVEQIKQEERAEEIRARQEAAVAAVKERRKKFIKRLLIWCAVVGIVLDLIATRQGWIAKDGAFAFYWFLTCIVVWVTAAVW